MGAWTGGWAAHLVAQKSSHTGLGGVTDGCEVMATLQGQHHCTSCQTHQLLCHVPKTYMARGEVWEGWG